MTPPLALDPATLDAAGDGLIACPQCGGAMRPRRADSLTRTRAYLIAAAILYLPANLPPVMQTASLTGTSRDTIISGMVYFWTSGSPDLAVLSLTVSVAAPLV